MKKWILKTNLTNNKSYAQQQFGKMAEMVLKRKFSFQKSFCAKKEVSASKSATSPSCKTLCATYFPNLRWKLLSYFSERNLLKLLPKILRENWKPNRTLSINFVLKLRFRVNPLWNQYLKLNVAWKFALRDNPNFAEKLCVEFFKFRKYYAAHNSGNCCTTTIF